MNDALSRLAEDRRTREQLAGEWGIHRFEFLASTFTTQEVARHLAEWENDELILVVTDYQSAGRGQHGRRWHSPPGSSLMFSLAVRPAGAASMALIPIRTGIAIARALDPAPAAAPRLVLKWPNDLMIGGRKMGGILSEGSLRGDDALAVIGVGINVRPFATEIAELKGREPAFLTDLLGENVDRLETLGRIIPAVRRSLEAGGPELSADELSQYARRDWLKGQNMEEPVPGRAMGINRYGHLLIERTDGVIEPVVAGRIHSA